MRLAVMAPRPWLLDGAAGGLASTYLPPASPALPVLARLLPPHALRINRPSLLFATRSPGRINVSQFSLLAGPPLSAWSLFLARARARCQASWTLLGLAADPSRRGFSANSPGTDQHREDHARQRQKWQYRCVTSVWPRSSKKSSPPLPFHEKDADVAQINKHGLPPGIELVNGDNLKELTLDIRVLDTNPLYKDQTYRLKFLFPDSYPIGMAGRVTRRPRADVCRRAPRGHLRGKTEPPNPHAPSHLFQWHHMPRPPWTTRLEPGTERRECLREHTEHAHQQLQEREAARRRGVCAGQQTTAARH